MGIDMLFPSFSGHRCKQFSRWRFIYVCVVYVLL